VAPLRVDASGVDLLAVDPLNPRLVEDLTFALSKDIRVLVADPDGVETLVQRHYGEDDARWEDVLADAGASGEAVEVSELSDEELAELAAQAPIVRLVNLVLAQAVKDQASDIHFEPFEKDYKIRYRVDGALYEMAPPPKQLALPIASRLKVLANLNIAERRVPQDGRIKITLKGRPVDLRISTLPTQFGESVVLRVLDQGNVRLDLAEIGLPPAIETGVRDVIQRPNGIFVVTGPTGSGKTTTLYSALRELNDTERKLLTAEDPVEYEIEGVMQVPINPGIGLSFARTLRTFLRQDPDIIMVGEIRDEETAQIAIQASLTGHLVLATLHTNDAAGAVTRLIDMGVEPFLISSSLEGVLAQRLVRRICPECSQAYEAPAAELEQLGLDPAQAPTFHRGVGCEHCSGSGYQGRHGLFEWLPISEALREMISQRRPTLELREQACREGMGLLREAGIAALAEGLTTVEEVLQYT
jgi:type IV pilus assembly protein PilB